MKFGIQSKENTVVLNMLFGIVDFVQNCGPAIELLGDFMKFGTKNKWSILIDIHSRPWANFILKLKCALLLFLIFISFFTNCVTIF